MAYILVIIPFLIVAIFLFNIIAGFFIGKIILLLLAIACGIISKRVCSDLDPKVFLGTRRKYVLSSFVALAALGLVYLYALTSEGACNGYYAGKLFDKASTIQQNGAYITNDNSMKVCDFPGYGSACKQYYECRRTLPPLRSIPLFFLGLICISIGSAIGFAANRKFILHEKLQRLRSPHSISGEKSKKSATPQFDLLKYSIEHTAKFEATTVAELSLLSGKSERAVRGFITRNGLRCADYQAKKS
jgi:hypothetical protein